jgi:hypothetical protein
MSAAAVFGICHTGHQAHRSVGDLLAAGFDNDDISVLVPFHHVSKDLTPEKNTKAAEGAPAAVAAGSAISGTLGLLAGLGVFAIPGVGPLVAAGPIMAALTGLGVGGATGGIIGALAGMGISRHRAKRYEGRIKDGGVLLSVNCDTSNESVHARELLKQAGAQDISASGKASADCPAAAPNRRQAVVNH